MQSLLKLPKKNLKNTPYNSLHSPRNIALTDSYLLNPNSFIIALFQQAFNSLVRLAVRHMWSAVS